MLKLNVDLGVREYKVGNGVMRFNPNDLNVYHRFLEAAQKIQDVEKNLVEKGKDLQSETAGEQVLQLMKQADTEVKEILRYVFGKDNDFDTILGGVNVMSVAGNGERVITNLLNALAPVLQEGAETCSKQQVNTAVKGAQLNRAQRRAMARSTK